MAVRSRLYWNVHCRLDSEWIRSIELVASPKVVGKGRGGYNEDNEDFGCKADI